MAQTSWQKLTLRTVTPAFLGRFDDVAQTGARIPFPVSSLRGVFGYWLRALIGAHVGDDLTDLRRAESAVFGAARTRTSGGPSAIWLRGPLIGVKAFPFGNDGVGYLAGPGLRDRNAPQARCLGPDMEIRLEAKNTGGPVQADLFFSALWALRTFGGIGARTRRGFGTVRVDRTPSLGARRFQMPWLNRNNTGDLFNVLECVGGALDELGIRRRSEDSQPAYPRFDLSGRWQVVGPDVHMPNAARYDHALDWTGQRLREFRHDGDPERATASYRDIVRPYLFGEPFTAAFRAGALGLPVVYTRKPADDEDEERSATVEPIVSGQPSRRASPLWLRVHGSRDTWWLRSLVFSAIWLPETGAELKIKATKGPALEPKSVQPPTPGLVQQELDRWFDYLSQQSAAAGE